MTPSFLDNMSWRMAEVYGAVTDRILINLAKYFAFVNDSAEVKGSFEYQARMLAKMGQVTKETVDIIANSLDGADGALRAALEAAIMDALKNEEPKLRQAAQLGLLGAVPPGFVPDQSQAFQAYYQQSADKLNLVNTVMLESTQAAYSATVADAAARLDRTQGYLNVAGGETITGVSTYNQAMRGAVAKMVRNGLTGFIDHAGRRWTPESYVAMDIRTTMFRTARAAVWERQDQYGNDLYQVSSHNGARPLCYPWQGKVISRSDTVRDVTDLDGNTVHVYAQSETSYGQAAGLFGVNCGHYPMSFIPGVSTLKGEPQDPAENEKTYAESQEQRALERKLRAERRDLAVMKAQGDSPEAIRKQQERVKAASAEIDDFCDRTGRARRKLREYTPINATWPVKDSYDPQTFPGAQRQQMQNYFGSDNKTTNVMPGAAPVAPTATPAPQTPQNVASQTTQTTAESHTIRGKTDKLEKTLSTDDYDEAVKMIDKSPTAKLYETYGDACKGITRTANGGVYRTGFDTVEYSLSKHDGMSKYSTMGHEMAHMFDAKIGRAATLTYKEVDTVNATCVIGSGASKTLKITPSVSDQFLTALRKDKETLKTILSKPEDITKMKTGKTKNASAGVQDAIDGFFGTQKNGILPWGHGDRYYNRIYNSKIKGFDLETEFIEALKQVGIDAKTKAKAKSYARIYDTASEAWANVLSAITCGGDELEAFKEYMPNTVAEALNIIGGL